MSPFYSLSLIRIHLFFFYDPSYIESFIPEQPTHIIQVSNEEYTPWSWKIYSRSTQGQYEGPAGDQYNEYYKDVDSVIMDSHLATSTAMYDKHKLK